MARIRTIKPEFPHSESMGRTSRDARLTFVQLWTLADDSGRLRGNSRMLASLLFPYDDDAKDLIEGWLGELEGEDCIQRYTVDGTSYVQVCNWLNHQKIDKPTPSKLPPPPEPSRSLANPREESSLDLDQGRDLEGIGREGTRAREVARETQSETRGVYDMGTNLTKTVEEIYGESFEAWRDVAGINFTAFEAWLKDLGRRGKPLQPHARMLQAKYLAGQGNQADQTEVVEHCMANEYRRLIPLEDVRRRGNGVARKPFKRAPTTAELEAEEAVRVRG